MLLRIADFFFVLRPLILVPAWSFYALGAHGSRRPVLATVLAAPGFWCLTAVLACAYVVNQVFDEESDRLNEKGHFVTGGLFGVRTMVAIAFACFVGASLLFQRADDAQRGPLIAALILAMAYSLPPIRLCARPWVDLAANAIGYGGLAFVIGRTGSGGALMASLADAGAWVLVVGATFLHTTILDVDGDTAARKRTTAVAIGVGRASGLAVVLALGGAALAAYRFATGRDADALVLVGSVVALATFVGAWAALRRARRLEPRAWRAARKRASSAAVQVVTAVVALAAVWRDPMFLLLLVPVVMAARAYYRARFGIPYPGGA